MADSRDPSDKPRPLGRERDVKPHGNLGTKYVTSALKRIARERPQLLDRAAHKLFLDAAGDSTVERAFMVDGEAKKYHLEISPDDRHRALALIRDTLQGKPQQELRVEGAALTNVIVLRAGIDEEPDMPDSVKEILARKEKDEHIEDWDRDEDDDLDA